MLIREPLLYSAECEAIPADEGEDIARAVAALRKLLTQSHDASGEFRRGVHVKSHGCAVASLQVLPNLPPELSQGLFNEAKTYEAILRFSNGSFFPQADALPDARGLAIKVLGVAGDLLERDGEEQAQDFVMVNHPVFFAGNVKEFARLEEALVEARESKITALKDALTGGESNPLQWHWRQIFQVAQTATHLPTHPAQYTYFSMAPMRFGQHIAKYRVRPAGDISTSLVESLGTLASERDAFRLLLQDTLDKQSLLFEFQVQVQTSPDSMPIEDASVEWPEDQSPYQTVGLVVVPRQRLDNAEEQTARERLSFNVWHALPEHQPLGGINRLRREIYPVSVRWRR